MLVGRARRGVAACLGVGAGRRCAVSCDRRWWREGWHVVLVQVVRGRGPCDQLHGWRVAVLLLGQLRDVPLGPLGGDPGTRHALVGVIAPDAPRRAHLAHQPPVLAGVRPVGRVYGARGHVDPVEREGGGVRQEGAVVSQGPGLDLGAEVALHQVRGDVASGALPFARSERPGHVVGEALRRVELHGQWWEDEARLDAVWHPEPRAAHRAGSEPGRWGGRRVEHGEEPRLGLLVGRLGRAGVVQVWVAALADEADLCARDVLPSRQVVVAVDARLGGAERGHV